VLVSGMLDSSFSLSRAMVGARLIVMVSGPPERGKAITNLFPRE